MFASEEYLLSWAVYLLSALVCLFVWWRMTRPVAWTILRTWFRVTIAVLLLLPISESAGSQVMAPAIVAVMIEAMTEGIKAAERGGYPLLMAMAAAYLLAFLYHMIKPSKVKIDKK